jgi:hypothetical protein
MGKKVPLMHQWIAPLLCACLILLGGCAGQVAPSGGPPDTIPPLIIATSPDSNATHATPDRIELEFSEYVERRSVEDAIFISPDLGKPEFDWSGTSVTIHFPERLRTNTTYVLTVGTDVVDIRAGNRMAHAFTLAFSTGDSIDRGSIGGRVFDEKPEGLMIFGYNLTGLQADTLDPTHTKPHYIVQTGKDGTFTLRNIARGTYRVVAVRDEYRNLLYDREIDQFGVTTFDPVITDDMPEVKGLAIRMAKEDTTRPFLASVAALDQRHLLVRFSEPVDTLAFPHTRFVLTDTASQTPTAISVQYQNMGNQALAHLETAELLDSTRTYRLTVRGISDFAKNQLDTNNASSVFNGPSTPDTLKAYPSVRGVADSGKGIATGRVFEMDFGRPVDLSGIMHATMLRDSTGRPLSIQVLPRTAAEVLVVPGAPLKSGSWYRLSVALDSLRDSRGTRYHDSIYTLRFQTIDTRTLGTIEGALGGDVGDPGVVVSASMVNAPSPQKHSVRLKHAGKYLMGDLPEGRYAVEAFEDLDGDGRYHAGLPFPFAPSARFAVYPDTVRVRARWSVEGVNLRLK